MNYQPPWTNTGALQQDVDSIRGALNQKADKHEISQILSTVYGLMDSIGALSTVVDGLRSRIEAFEGEQRTR